MTTRNKKWIAGTLAVVIVLGGGYFTYTKTTASTQEQALTRVLPVHRGDVTETVSASGTVQAAAPYNLNFAGGSGTVAALNVKVGDHVKAGQVLAQLDSTTQQLQLQSDEEALAAAEAKDAQAKQSSSTQQAINVQQTSVEKAKASLDGAQTAFADEQNIYNQLVRSNAPQSQLLPEKAKLDQMNNQIAQAQASYDAAIAQLNQAQAPADNGTIAQAQAAVDQAQLKVTEDHTLLANMSIKAPVDGVIVAVNGAAGELATSGGNGGSGNNGLITMDGTAAGMEIAAQISQSDIGKVQVGQQVAITTTAFQDKTFTGTVSQISPEATTANGVTTYNAIVKVNDPNGLLKAGMSTSVAITVGTHQHVLYVSPAALKEQNGHEGVYVANANAGQGGQNGSSKRSTGFGNGAGAANGHFVPVTVGYFNNNQVEITSGLQDGDSVIITIAVPQASSSSSKKSSTSSMLGGLTGGFGGGGFGGGYGGYGGASNRSGGSSRGGN